ncbi:flagella biosynthesis regulatory protein FliT [Serratia symbiotica]|uniref:flagella biosynthesis regulatory protein FliT n=1 Tax=Serratia symbiotica TaxID=138074 RepID=UPI003463DAEF
MEHQQQLLAAYQHIYALSSKMIVLAQSGQWEALVEQEFAYVTAVEKTAAFTALSGSSVALCNQLKQILDNETILKHLLQQRMEELKTLVSQSTRQNVVNKTYGQFQDHALLLGESQNR